MPRKTRSELLNEYVERIDRSRRWREQEGLDQTWWRLNDLYRGRHWPQTTAAQRDLIAVNLSFSTVNVIAPSVSVNHPKIVVAANNPEDSKKAVAVEAVVNHLWRHHDFQSPFRRAVKDFLIFGHGWVKVGWKFVEQEMSLTDVQQQDLLDG